MELRFIFIVETKNIIIYKYFKIVKVLHLEKKQLRHI